MKGSTLRLVSIFFAVTSILFATSGIAAKKEKTLICHVGSGMGPGDAVYLDDPTCEPEEGNGYFCPNAGKIDLIVVAKPASHIDNPSHAFEGFFDYEPDELGASGIGTEDSDGNGIDDGCEPQEICPCWDKLELQNITVDNHLAAASCSSFSNYPTMAIVQDDFSSLGVEGGFFAESAGLTSSCNTRDFPGPIPLSVDEANVCVSQIATRCAELGDPIIP